MMHRLQSVEKQNAQFTDVFGMGLITVQAPREGPGAGDDLARCSVVAVRFFSRESVVGDFLQNSFAKTHGGNGHAADIQIAAESKKRDGGNTHDIGTVAAYTVSLHALADIAFQDVRQALAQER